MGINPDAEKDLTLEPEDAEEVVGGMAVGANKKAAKHATHHTAAHTTHAAPSLIIQTPVALDTTMNVPDENVDGSSSPAAAGDDSGS